MSDVIKAFCCENLKEYISVFGKRPLKMRRHEIRKLMQNTRSLILEFANQFQFANQKMILLLNFKNFENKIFNFSEKMSHKL